MESNTIYCPLHPKEKVMRVDTEFGAEKELYCIECLLHTADAMSMANQLKPIDDFIDSAAKYYESNRKTTEGDSETPEEYQEILAKQNEALEQLSSRIESEKTRVTSKFDTILKDVVKMITEKRDEYVALLDKQLFNYRYGFVFYEKQLRKAFPKAEDSNLYPTKEELCEKYSKLQNATQLMAFVKNLKEDLNETKMFSNEEGLSPSEARRFLIKNVSKRLEEFKGKTPTLVDNDADYDKAREDIEKAVNKMVNSLFTLNNEIDDVSGGDAHPKSSLAKGADWGLIKKWMKDVKHKKLTPLYRASKDGMNSTTFHEKCNNKGATLILYKSTAGKIFGGYMPLAWTSSNNYLNTRESFLFSLTAKAKYEMNDPNTYQQYGGYDYYNYGPCFGGGHDLYICNDFNTNSNYCNRHSYNFPDNTTLTGGYNFTLEEIEVFQVNK